MALWHILGIIVLIVFASGIRIVRPTHRGLIERMGKFNRHASEGFNWIVPIIDRIYKVDVTEQMSKTGDMEIITKDNLNSTVNAAIYYKINKDPESVKNSQYNVDDIEYNLETLAQSALRNINGKLTIAEANSDRTYINSALQTDLQTEISSWGVTVTRAEILQIDPPEDVQDSMNRIVKANNRKTESLDLATAAVNEAEGQKKVKILEAEANKESSILQAEAQKQSEVLIAEGEAERVKKIATANANALEVESKAAQTHFTGNAQTLKKLEVTSEALRDNAKVIVPADSNLMNLVGNLNSEA